MKNRKRKDTPLGERRTALKEIVPYVGIVSAPPTPPKVQKRSDTLAVATYNVHRWEPPGRKGVASPAQAATVVEELAADVVALQEVVRPFEGDDPLVRLAHRLGHYFAFVTTRIHPRGELGNAILSRWPMRGVSVLDLRFSRMERRTALAVVLGTRGGALSLVATHLALVGRTRRRQVRHLLDHPVFVEPLVLLGDMNIWRERDRSGLTLDAELPQEDVVAWPKSFPAAKPALPLDRVYARGATVLDIRAHESPAARRASDHLPVVARIRRMR